MKRDGRNDPLPLEMRYEEDFEPPKPSAFAITKAEAQLELPLDGKAGRSIAANLMASIKSRDEIAKEWSDSGKHGREQAEEDMVHLPKHYAQYEIEPIRFIVENFGPAFLIGNIIKYVMRYKAKNGLEDLRKAARYNEMLLQFEDGNKDWWR